MFYAGLLAIFWTCVFYFEDATKNSVGKLNDYDNSLFSMKFIYVFINTWCYFMDQKFLWMIKLSVFS